MVWMVWIQCRISSWSNGLAANAFITTNTAAAMAMIVWIDTDYLKTGKPNNT